MAVLLRKPICNDEVGLTVEIGIAIGSRFRSRWRGHFGGEERRAHETEL